MMPGHIRLKGRGRHVRRVPGQPNKLEAKYGEHLQLRLIAGEIAQYTFEGVKLRLADKTFYSPDYFVMLSDGTIEMHEVKGFWEDHARVKIKVAAAMWPFNFVAVRWVKREWVFERF